jgi:cell division protein FtsN
MTKDYKNVPRHGGADKKRSAKKGTVKSGNSGNKAKPLPGWVWMLGGLAIGLIIAVAVYFSDRGGVKVAAVKPPAESPKHEAPVKEGVPAVDVEKKKEPRFDFYTLLPEFEVIIPDSEIKEERAKMKPKEDVAYMIQVGSFRKYGEADSLKAQLALLGVEADIDPVSSQGEQWLRVRVGPFTDTRKLNQVRNRLHDNNINTMLVQIKK